MYFGFEIFWNSFHTKKLHEYVIMNISTCVFCVFVFIFYHNILFHKGMIILVFLPTNMKQKWKYVFFNKHVQIWNIRFWFHVFVKQIMYFRYIYIYFFANKFEEKFIILWWKEILRTHNIWAPPSCPNRDFVIFYIHTLKCPDMILRSRKNTFYMFIPNFWKSPKKFVRQVPNSRITSRTILTTPQTI